MGEYWESDFVAVSAASRVAWKHLKLAETSLISECAPAEFPARSSSCSVWARFGERFGQCDLCSSKVRNAERLWAVYENPCHAGINTR